VKTIEYPWYMPPFSEYNVAQSTVVPFLDKDVNLVISFATAAGKTTLAEGAMAYHLASDSECRVAYICPFKSIASEKYRAWMDEPQLSNHGVALWSSDSDDCGGEDTRLVVATLESFDFKTRSDVWRPFVKSFCCVVFDEAHLIGESPRGGAMEAAMMRLTDFNKNARIILLSATMSNAMDIAKWVKSLNGKPTKCIKSSWRPTKIQVEYHEADGHDEELEKAIELASASASRKTLVFVHSKVIGGEIVKRLRQCGVRTLFHNASLSGAKRRKIEDVFSDPTSGMNVVVSTSTLGHGVNM
jgi:replicative superfamily II helicase